MYRQHQVEKSSNNIGSGIGVKHAYTLRDRKFTQHLNHFTLDYEDDKEYITNTKKHSGSSTKIA